MPAFAGMTKPSVVPASFAVPASLVVPADAGTQVFLSFAGCRPPPAWRITSAPLWCVILRASRA